MTSTIRNSIFYAVMFIPLIIISTVPLYALYFTNLPQLLYTQSIRNINFDCFEFVPDPYVYKMKPGKCKLHNIGHDTTLTHNSIGYRISTNARTYNIAAIGDSHTYGFDVEDDQTFSYVLGAEHNYHTMNLGISSYATMRELEALEKYGREAKYVVVQYCENDLGENQTSLRLDKEDFRAQAEANWKNVIATYYQGKSIGHKFSIETLGRLVRNGSFVSRSVWRGSVDGRRMEQEANVFARIIDRYRPLLEGKRLIIFESSSWGLNSARFAATFAPELSKLAWLNYRIIESTAILTFDDYHFLDDHLRPIGHRKLAAAIANEITQWERNDPLLKEH